MWKRGGDLGIIDCHKLSTELENFTFPLIEDTEGGALYGPWMRRVRAVRRKLHLCRPHMGGPGMRLQPVLRMSLPRPLGCVMLPAVWMRP